MVRRLLTLGIDVMMTDPCVSVRRAPLHHALAAGDFDLYLQRRGRPRRDGDHQTDGRDEAMGSVAHAELGAGVYLARSRELTRRFFDDVVRALVDLRSDPAPAAADPRAPEARVFGEVLARWDGPVVTAEGRVGDALHVHGLNRAAFPDEHFFTRYEAVGRRYPPPVLVWPGHEDAVQARARALEVTGHWHASHPATRRLRRVTADARRGLLAAAMALSLCSLHNVRTRRCTYACTHACMRACSLFV